MLSVFKTFSLCVLPTICIFNPDHSSASAFISTLAERFVQSSLPELRYDTISNKLYNVKFRFLCKSNQHRSRGKKSDHKEAVHVCRFCFACGIICFGRFASRNSHV